MKCKVCGQRLDIRSRISESLPDGRLKITRHVKCRGPVTHVYELIEIRSTAAPQAAEYYSSKARRLSNMDRVGRYEGLLSSDDNSLDPFRQNRDRPARSTPAAVGKENVAEPATPAAKKEDQKQDSDPPRPKIPRIPDQYRRDPFDIDFDF